MFRISKTFLQNYSGLSVAIKATQPPKCKPKKFIPLSINPIEKNKRLFTTTIVKKTSSEVLQSDGLKQFLRRTYKWLATGVAGSVSTALMCASLDPFLCFGVGLVGGLSSIGILSYVQPTKHIEERIYEKIHYSINPPLRVFGYGLLVASMGMSIAPMCAIYGTGVLVNSLAATGLVFGSCFWYAQRFGTEKLLSLQGPLTIGLVSLVGMQLFGIAHALFTGDPNLLSALFEIDTYASIALFSGFAIYDTYVAKKMYLEGNADHLHCSTSLFLDFMNLLVRIMKIIGESKKH